MRALGCARAIPAGRSRVRERERVSRGDARVRTRGVRPGSRGVRLADARSRLSFFLSPPPREVDEDREGSASRGIQSGTNLERAFASYRGSANWETRPGGGEKRKRSSRRSREVRKIRSISCFLFRGWPGQRAAGKSTTYKVHIALERDDAVPAFDCSSLGLFAVVGTLRPRSALVASPRARRHGGRQRALPEGARGISRAHGVPARGVPDPHRARARGPPRRLRPPARRR